MRRDAEAAARQLLDGSAGEMTEQQFREFFGLLSTDFHNGKQARGRFAPGFVGQYINTLVANLETLNEWTATLWRGSDDEVLDALGRLLADRKLLPGAGTSYPSMLLYLRRPGTWAVWGPSIDGGLRRVTKFSARTPQSGRLEDYEAFSAAATALAAEHELPYELLDEVLSAASRTTENAPPPSRSANAWTFQANPAYYDIDRALHELPEIEWTVRQSTRSVSKGDRAYIWRSGTNAGIVAVGTVADDIEARGPDPSEIEYYLRREDFERVEPRVSIRVDRVLQEPLLRVALQEDPVLSELGVIRFANATVHRVQPEEDKRIRELLGEWEPGEVEELGHRVWWVNQGSTWEVERGTAFSGHRRKPKMVENSATGMR